MITNTDLIVTKNHYKVCLQKQGLPNKDTEEFNDLYTIRLLYIVLYL